MSEQELQKAKNPYDLIERAKKQFIKIAENENTGINYEKESAFAYQALLKNDFTLSTAMNSRGGCGLCGNQYRIRWPVIESCDRLRLPGAA